MLKIVTGASEPILRKVIQPVTVFDGKLKNIAEEMIETMSAPDPNSDVVGIGLAANQVGLDMRLMIVTLNIETKKKQRIVVMVNPEIIEMSEKTVFMEEGCLSLPGESGKVMRPSKLKLRWQNLDGNWAERKFEGWDARVIQHEVDHLNGILFTDYLKK